MFQGITFVALYLLIRSTNALLPSPCPNIFAYEGEPDRDRWRGVVTIFSNIELVGLNFKIQLDYPAHLLVSGDGEVRTDDNINFSIFDPNQLQRAGETKKATIMVKYDPLGIIPSVVKIIINGNTMCSGDFNTMIGHTGSTESFGVSRPDPTFSEESPVFEYNNRPTNLNANSGVNRPTYNNEPNYNSAGQNYQNSPVYNPNSVSNPPYNGGGSHIGSSVSGGFSNGNSVPNYSNNAANNNPSYPNNNPSYSNSANNFAPPDNVYSSNHQSNSGFNNVQPQWTESPQTNSNINRNNSGQVNNGGPLVTTLTLPNNTQNKNNIDTIVQIIKNQLEQQQGTTSTNNTVIVALVSPVNTHAVQQTASNGPTNRDIPPETTTHAHRTTTTSTPSPSIVSKVRTTTSTPITKSSSPRNKD